VTTRNSQKTKHEVGFSRIRGSTENGTETVLKDIRQSIEAVKKPAAFQRTAESGRNFTTGGTSLDQAFSALTKVITVLKQSNQRETKLLANSWKVISMR